MEKMKMCPFCGEDYAQLSVKTKDIFKTQMGDKERLQTRSQRFKIFCSNCGCGTGWTFYKEDAIAAWNRRTAVER